MSDLTVGNIEDILRKFPRDTPVHLSCRHCHHSISGARSILEVSDKTNQTYGYVELEVNQGVTPSIECSPDKEEFYKSEISRLQAEIAKQDKDLQWCDNFVESVETSLRILRQWSNTLSKK